MTTQQLTEDHTSIQTYVQELRHQVDGIEVLEPGTGTTRYSHDAATAKTAAASGNPGPAVVLPLSATEVQTAVRLAAELGLTVVPRGAGTGLSGGATAQQDQVVISTEKLTNVIEVSPLDEVAVVEPGVINADLNNHLESFGLFYAPDPASFDISSIGGNIATNAGGLRCAKYGVTRESILSLDVVLPDGSLITVGHRSIKGVTGLDLTSLFVGSEGILGIVTRATVRLRPIPVARKTVSAFFNSTAEGTDGLAAITLSPVRPAAIEFFDTPSLANIDAHSGTSLRERGAALILIEIDGYGIGDQAADLATALSAVGGRVTVESDDDAVRLWELRRSGRGLPQDKWYIGEDIAVPKSQLPKVYAAFPALEARFGVDISALSHAGDGNLHPLITKDKTPDDGANPPASLLEAATELVKVALSLGGTVTGEHGVGTIKREWAALELSERSREVQHAIKAAIDPQQTLNPGKAI
ncbi:FAD-binding oxidoreductase [Arthrobacter sp. MYb23]|uniref:FAD-binding oxidoreductase n=1 Tax=unclassified Arthrobacter TaxID=235627 RepID=UPI000CFBA1BA|nr:MULTISPECIES: FAD-linked oxidase C-terminal domain-containing protein [unclassified Arthrobacter]PRB43796.1 FAD-binding oxidoreductase [Arthrobacter sp. MYb51]PRB97402.1 FAD-binding oxidoreductase [Arthrobacter sp. MYb23]